MVVTGSVLHHKLGDTVAPLTVLTASDLTTRGISTVQEGIQSISANGADSPAQLVHRQRRVRGQARLPVSCASERRSTLTLFDGLRVTYYPLADDGTRNFVDLNTIPDVIVDRIETSEGRRLFDLWRRRDQPKAWSM